MRGAMNSREQPQVSDPLTAWTIADSLEYRMRQMRATQIVASNLTHRAMLSGKKTQPGSVQKQSRCPLKERTPAVQDATVVA
jgi:hypothetical protein